MSKAVSAVARSVTNVVKGAVKLVKSNILGVAKIAKDVAKSKLGKILIMAAVIYFGGAALAGGFGSAGAGGSFLSGMGTGVSSAASSLSSAWGSAMAGEFSAAGSTVGNAWGTAGTAGATAGADAAAAAAATSTPVSGVDLGGAGASPATTGAPTTVAGAPPVAPAPAAPPPAAGMTVGEGLMGAAKIQAGTAIIGGAMQGKAAQDQQEDQRAYEMEQARLARERYNENAGARLFSDQQPVSGGYSTPSGAYAYDPLAEANAVSNRRINEYNARQGLVSRNMA